MGTACKRFPFIFPASKFWAKPLNLDSQLFTSKRPTLVSAKLREIAGHCFQRYNAAMMIATCCEHLTRIDLMDPEEDTTSSEDSGSEDEVETKKPEVAPNKLLAGLVDAKSTEEKDEEKDHQLPVPNEEEPGSKRESFDGSRRGTRNFSILSSECIF